LDYPDSVQQ